MKRQGNGNPGRALARTTGAEVEIQLQANFQSQIYATCRDLQTAISAVAAALMRVGPC